MIEYLILTTIVITFIIASIEDIKKREVYDYINFSLAFFVLVVAAFHSLIIDSLDPLKYVAFGMILGFGLGALLFYFGIWGGGDAKFLLGFSAASFYLLTFTPDKITHIGEIYYIAMNMLSAFFTLFLSYFLGIIIILDFIFAILVVLQFFFTKRNEERKDLIFLMIVLFVLTIGLVFNYSTLTLVFLGFLAFVLIFFAREGVFSSVYFKYKKHLQDLKHGDILDEDVVIGARVKIPYDETSKGLTKEDVHIIQESLKHHTKTKDVFVKKALPYSTLISLNYLMYLFKVITIDEKNLEILSFMFEYLFFSFISGGVLAVVVVFYYFFKNYHQVKLDIKNWEWITMIVLFVLTSILLSVSIKFSYLYLLIPLYIFVKMAISIEHVAFIRNKKLSNIVLGDWIVQDIKAGDRVIYHKEDFKIGVDEYQLAKIQELAKHHKNLNKILVKDGIAFLPALFLGFILTFLI